MDRKPPLDETKRIDKSRDTAGILAKEYQEQNILSTPATATSFRMKFISVLFLAAHLIL